MGGPEPGHHGRRARTAALPRTPAGAGASGGGRRSRARGTDPGAVAERGVAAYVARSLRPGRHRLGSRPPADRGGGRGSQPGGGGHGVGGAAVGGGTLVRRDRGRVRPPPGAPGRASAPDVAGGARPESGVPPTGGGQGCRRAADHYPGEIGVLRGALRVRAGRGRRGHRHGGVLRPGLARGARAVRRLPDGADRHRAGAARAGARGREQLVAPGDRDATGVAATGPDVPVALQRARSSIATAVTWPRPTCSIPLSGVAGEYEGGVHLAAGQRASDVLGGRRVLRAVRPRAGHHGRAPTTRTTTGRSCRRFADAYDRAESTSPAALDDRPVRRGGSTPPPWRPAALARPAPA